MPLEDAPAEAGEASLLTDAVPDGPLDGGVVGAETPAPVEATARLDAVDVLRGVALLGILTMNVAIFAWPYEVYHTPTAAPGHGWGDLVVWMFNRILFDTKMMSIFSMLFGAGLVLMSERAEARGASLARTYYRRILVLLAIGLVHAYLIWEGDILVVYALCGLFLYPFRRKSAVTLVAIGVALLAVAVPAWLVGRAVVGRMEQTTRKVDAQLAAGETPSQDDRDARDAWAEMKDRMTTTPEEFAEEVAAYRGGYPGIVAARAGDVFEFHTWGFLLATWWMVGGRMFLGMGLMKLGVFSAGRSDRFYARMALVGYGVGLPLVLCDLAAEWRFDFFTKDYLGYFTRGWWLFHEAASLPIALGHVAVVMLLYRAGAFPRLARRLAAVGRMALTNYLMTSIVCTTIFYGYGLGLYGRLHRPALVLVVVAVWAVQLLVSRPWLEHFRFGPAEWAWRSLTYGRAQPFRRRAQTTS